MPQALPGLGPVMAQADNDQQVIQLWLFGKSERTKFNYLYDLDQFLTFVQHRPIRWIRLGDLQAWVDSMAHLAPRTRGARLAAVKSLLSFAHKIGYTTLNCGAAVKAPKAKGVLAQRILTEAEMMAMIARNSRWPRTASRRPLPSIRPVPRKSSRSRRANGRSPRPRHPSRALTISGSKSSAVRSFWPRSNPWSTSAA